MKAVIHEKSLPISDPNSLKDARVPIPRISESDILVRVKAVAVNPVDAKHRMRTEATVKDGIMSPVILGYDAAGTIEAIGSKVEGFKIADEVFYAGDIRRPGANSEFQAVDHRIVGRKPSTLSFAQAAALPLTSLTAYEALFEQLMIDPNGKNAGRTILIIGGAGGVGSIAVQMAKKAGLIVIASASRPESRQWVKEMGADFVIGRDRPLIEELKAAGQGEVDFILNTASTHEYWQQMIDATKPKGRLVSIVESPEKVDITALMRKSLSFSYELMFTRTLYETNDLAQQGKILSEVSWWVDQGMLQSTSNEVLGVINAENLKKAHELIESRSNIGKIILEGWVESSSPRILRVNAFTAKAGVPGGNPAGVVLNADRLSPEEKQAIAKEIGYSETAFVTSSAVADFKLEFFTPTRQVPDCGHATVAAFSVLSRLDPSLTNTSKEIVEGQRREIKIEDGMVYMEQPLPKFETWDTLRKPLDPLFTGQFAGTQAWVARNDNAFLIIEVESENMLSKLIPNLKSISEWSERNNWVGIYVFTRNPSKPNDISTRMFAPAYGIAEESATGMAAGLLSAVLHGESGESSFNIRQGFHMPIPSPSILNASVRPSENAVWVGGYASIQD